jgi:hypothetical protein
VNREALEDYFDGNNATTEGRVEATRRHRSKIEQLIRAKYLRTPAEDAEAVLLKTNDFEKLSALVSAAD